MSAHKVSIKHVNNEHSDWLRALSFYKDELTIIKQRLTEIAGKNTGKDVMVLVDHFENQITLQSTNIDTLKHDINEVVKNIATQAQSLAGYLDESLVSTHTRLREKFITEETIVNAFRREFNVFAAKWM